MVQPVGKSDKGQGLFRRHGPFRDLGYQLDIFTCRESGNEIVELEYEPDMFAPILGQGRLCRAGQLMISPSRIS